MKINLKVRIKNKVFWLAFVPTVLLLIEAVAAVFGFTLDFTLLGNKLVKVVEVVFTLLAIIGVAVDPTTKGISDSTQAMNYNEPKGE